MAWRDSRSQRGRLVLFSLAIVSGIAALVALHSLKATVQKGIGTQARALLGSDVQISSRQPFSAADEAQLTRRARAVSHETSLSTMLFFPAANAARLVQVRGLDGAYPFYGQVETTPAAAWTRLRAEPGIVALLAQFQAKVGD
jgi:putative ABC transport system permease protein